MKDLAKRTRNEDSATFTYTSVWDADKIKGCHCDSLLTSYDCSMHICPSGDDPLTIGQVNEVQLLECLATTGSFVLFYNGVPSASIPHTANADQVKKALLTIPQLTAVDVAFSQVHGTVCQVKSNIISIEFTQQFGEQRPLVPLADASMLASGGTVTISADGISTLTDVSGTEFKSVKGTKENDLCSSRGICDHSTGLCHCFDTNGDAYGSSDGYGNAGTRGDCGHVKSSTLTTGISTCPGLTQCSGHGVCDTTSYRCYCSAGFYGGDCSLMECPQGRTWYGYPTADESAHLDYTECSNMGHCDNSHGKCICREGFYGEACEYMACGGGVDNLCSGHGRCMTMAELALWANDNGDETHFVYGSEYNNFFTWDFDRVHGCLCDTGFSGYDCSLVDCPRGDDPGSYEDHTEVQLLQCVANGGNFTLSFRQSVTPPLSFNTTAGELRSALTALPTIDNIYVYFIADALPPNGTLNFVKPTRTQAKGIPAWGGFIGPNGTFAEKFNYIPAVDIESVAGVHGTPLCNTDGTQIAILHFEFTHGNLPAIIPDTSNLGDFVNFNGVPGTGVINVFTDGADVLGLQSIQGTTETDFCNNRGLCDRTTGLCHCFEDWISSDGSRQGDIGSTGDCGHRQNQKNNL